MRPRNTALLLLAALLLGGFIYLYDGSVDEAEPGEPEAGGELFDALRPDDVEAVRLRTKDGIDAEIEREGGGWRVTAPLHADADDVALEAIVSQLAQLEIAGRVESPGDRAGFGLDEGAGQVAFRAGGEWRGLRIGKPTPVGSNTYVSRNDSEEIVYVASWRVQAYRKSLAELRNRQVMDFDQAGVSRIAIGWPGAQVEIERRDDAWWMTAPVNERADEQSVENLLSDLAFLRADDFVDAADRSPEEMGLEPTALHVVLHGETEAGEPFAKGLMLGEVREGRRVARGSSGALYSVAPERLDDFPRELIAWRDKDLAHFVVADARALELTFRSPGESERTVSGVLRAGEWAFAQEPMAARRARALVRVLSALEAVEIVAEDMGEDEREALGLAPARVSVRVEGEGGVVLADVDFGVREADRGPLAMRADRAIVYRIGEEDGEAIPADWADFDGAFRPGDDEALDDGFGSDPEIEGGETPAPEPDLATPVP